MIHVVSTYLDGRGLKERVCLLGGTGRLAKLSGGGA